MRSNERQLPVIASTSEAIQKSKGLDCFVALLLAMTRRSDRSYFVML